MESSLLILKQHWLGFYSIAYCSTWLNAFDSIFRQLWACTPTNFWYKIQIRAFEETKVNNNPPGYLQGKEGILVINSNWTEWSTIQGVIFVWVISNRMCVD